MVDFIEIREKVLSGFVGSPVALGLGERGAKLQYLRKS